MMGYLDDLTLNYDQLRTQVHYFAKTIVIIWFSSVILISYVALKHSFGRSKKRKALLSRAFTLCGLCNVGN